MNHNIPITKMGGVQRSKEISFIRLISLLMIITCHIMQWLNMELAWWFNVGVQVFLCISGWLYGQKNVDEVTAFYLRRFKKILIPYFIVFIPYGVLQFFLARDVFVGTSFLKGLLVNATLKGAGHLWFVATILMCYVLTPLLAACRDRCVNSRKSWILYLLLSVEIATVFFGLFDKYFNPAWISCYVIGYALGINTLQVRDGRAKEESKERHCIHSRYVKESALAVMFGILAVIGNGIQIYCSYFAHKDFTGYQTFCDFNHVTLGVLIFLLLKMMFACLNLTRLTVVLDFTDKYSYEMYLTHHLIILGPFSLMGLTSVIALNIAIILISTVVLAWVVKQLTSVIEPLVTRLASVIFTEKAGAR